MKIELFGLPLPEVRPGDDLVRLLVESAAVCGGLQAGDVLVVTSKVISKAKGLVFSLAEVEPSRAAHRLAARTGLDSRYIELVLRNSEAILCVVPLKAFWGEGIVDPAKLSDDEEAARRMIEAFPYEIFVLREGDVYSSAGVDTSNHPAGQASVPPPNADAAARELREKIRHLTGLDIPVVVSDTEYTLSVGTQDVARGCSGCKPVAGKFGRRDRFGKPKFGGADLVAHELAAAAALLMGQTDEGIPAVLVRGFRYTPADEGMTAYRFASDKAARAFQLIITHSVRVLGLWWLLRFLRRLILPGR